MERPNDYSPQTFGGDAHSASAPSAVSRPHELQTLRCRTVAAGRFGQRHHVRDLQPIKDAGHRADPETLLVEDEQPHPSEMLLVALGACLSASIQANAVARGIPVRSLEVHTSGTVDPSALWGTGERRARPLGFQTIAISVEVDAVASVDALKALVDYAVLWSPVANTLHDPVHIDVIVAKQ